MPMIFLMYDDQQVCLKMPWDSKPIPPVVQPTNPKWRDREIFPGPWSCQWPICKLLLLHFALQFLLNSISKSFGDIWLLEKKPGETSCYSTSRVIMVIHPMGNILQDSCWKSRLQHSSKLLGSSCEVKNNPISSNIHFGKTLNTLTAQVPLASMTLWHCFKDIMRTKGCKGSDMFEFSPAE